MKKFGRSGLSNHFFLNEIKFKFSPSFTRGDFFLNLIYFIIKMKKILIYVTLSFIISNISFAKKSGCTDGDCNNGFGTWTYTDKTTYVGQWENGSKKGKGVETWPNGYVYEGDFNDSKWHGVGILKFPDGSSYSGEWKNNKMHGSGVFKWSDGKVIKGTWKEGDYVK